MAATAHALYQVDESDAEIFSLISPRCTAVHRTLRLFSVKKVQLRVTWSRTAAPQCEFGIGFKITCKHFKLVVYHDGRFVSPIRLSKNTVMHGFQILCCIDGHHGGKYLFSFQKYSRFLTLFMFCFVFEFFIFYVFIYLFILLYFFSHSFVYNYF